LSFSALAWNGGRATRPRAPLEASGNRRPREMATQKQNPAYRVASPTKNARASHDARAFPIVWEGFIGSPTAWQQGKEKSFREHLCQAYEYHLLLPCRDPP